MEQIADILLVAGTIGSAFYCMILARRLRSFGNLEAGVGGAVALLAAQVAELKKSLSDAQQAAGHSNDSLELLIRRAEKAANRLELMVAAAHEDVPDVRIFEKADPKFARRPRPEKARG